VGELMRYFRQVLAGAIASCYVTGAAAGANEVTFIDGGYAEMCSSVAHNAEDADFVELTGSRLRIPAVDICTLAIEDEATAPADKAGAYNNRGVLRFEEGNFDQALADFDAALAIVETLAAAHINRGYTLVAMERWANSIEAFDRGIELGAPEPARAHFNRGIAHEELGHVRDAYNDYKRASELDPLWEEPKRELARFTVR
jgi:tetratricopeptide (TPR) repeat protein